MGWTRLGLLTLSLVLTACGGGGGGSSAPRTTLSDNAVVAVGKRIIQAGVTCPNGGFEVDMGVDSNQNGLLDSGEITSTEVVCNGLSGADGAAGSDGSNGNNGLNTLVKLTQVNDVVQCVAQGVKIEAGLDTNGNAQLDALEVTATSYLCDGSAIANSNQTPELSAKGIIVGSLNMSQSFLPVSRSLATTSTRKVTSQFGELWLTPSDILGAIQADQAATQQAQQLPAALDALVPPVVEAINIPIAQDGSFEISVPAGTDYELAYITPDGSQGVQVAQLIVEPNTQTQVLIEEASLQATGSVQIALYSQTTGAPLEGVEVVLLNGGIQTLTDAQGSALLEKLAPGKYTLMAHHEQYLSKTFSFVVQSNVDADLGVLELNNLRGRASGTVQAFGLSSQANIVVYARDAQGSVYTTLSDNNGIFTFNALPVGEGYSFIAQANDFKSSKQDNIQIELGRTASVGNIELAPKGDSSASITGYAKFAEYAQLQNVHAGIIVSIEGTDIEAITSRDGAYVINGLTAGNYTLNFTDSNHQTSTLQNVKVAKTTTTNLKPQTLQSLTGSLSGSVVNANNVAVANATLLIAQTGATVQTDVNGLFTFSDIYSGDFTLQVSKDGYQGFSTVVKVKANESLALGVFNIDAFSISGTVNLTGLQDHAGILVSIKNSSFNAVTDSSGEFYLAGMVAGTYQLQFTQAGYQTQTTSVTITREQPATSLPSAMALSQYSLNGTVELTNASDHSAITISLLGTAFSTQTDTNGAFSLAGITPGTYQLQVSKAGFQVNTLVVNIDAATPSHTLASTVTLSQFSVTGVAQLQGLSDHSAITVSVLGTGLTTQTASDGSFTLTGIPVGDFKLMATKADYQSQETTFSMSNENPSLILNYSLVLLPSVGVAKGVITLENQIAHGGVLVELLGTSYTTFTDNLGGWSIDLPIGNYGGGIRYSANLFATTTANETITVTENGQYQALPKTLAQEKQTLTLDLSSVGQTCSALQVNLQGTAGDALGYSETFNHESSLFSQELLLGSYTLTASCDDAGFETVIRMFTLTADGELAVVIEPISLRERFITINGGADFTNNQTVTLTLGASDAVQMRISETPGGGSFENYATTKSFSLTAGDTSKTVYVAFKDSFGSVTPEVSDTILLDTSATIASLTENTSGATKGRGATIHFSMNTGEINGTATVSINGYAGAIALLDDGTQGDAAANDGIYELDYIIEGPVDVIAATITGNFTDSAGNSATPITNGAITIQSPPLISSVKVVTSTIDNSATITYLTDETATAQVQHGLDNGYGSTTNSGVNATSHTVLIPSLSQGVLYHFRAQATDGQGNVGTVLDNVFRLAPMAPLNVVAMAGDARVDIVWDLNSEMNVKGYHVYRADVSGGAYTKVNASLVVDTIYPDLTAVNDSEYFYVVSAVDVFDNVGSYSLESNGTPLANNGGTSLSGILTPDENGRVILTTAGSPYTVDGVVGIRLETDIELYLAPGVEITSGENSTIEIVNATVHAQGTLDTQISITGVSFRGVGFKSIFKFIHANLTGGGIYGSNDRAKAIWAIRSTIGSVSRFENSYYLSTVGAVTGTPSAGSNYNFHVNAHLGSQFEASFTKTYFSQSDVPLRAYLYNRANVVRYNTALAGLDIYLGCCTSSGQELDFSYNYWGADLTSEMETFGDNANLPGINDYLDNFTLPKVKYSNWLANPLDFTGPKMEGPNWPEVKRLSVTNDQVSVTLRALGAVEMMVSQDGTFTDAAQGDTAFHSYDFEYTFTSSNTGETIFARFRDAAGKESYVAVEGVRYEL